jgi:hypothetical protein
VAGKMKTDQAGVFNSGEDVYKKAFGDFCVALDAYGPREILDLLVINSRRDEIIYQLLVRFPTVVALGDFLATLPIVKSPKRKRARKGKKGITS